MENWERLASPDRVICDVHTHAAPVVFSPAIYLCRSLSSYGMTMPTHSAPPRKKNISRQTKELYALRINLRGFSASAAAMEMNSGPTIVNEPWIMQERKPKKRPVSPGAIYSTNEPWDVSAADFQVGFPCKAMTYRILPVPEAIRIVLRVPADHRDEGVPHQAEHEEDLEDGEIEFSDAKIADRQSIEDPVLVSDVLQIQLKRVKRRTRTYISPDKQSRQQRWGPCQSRM